MYRDEFFNCQVTTDISYIESRVFYSFLFYSDFHFSQKDLENLKAEVQRRQQLQELGKSEEPAEDGPLELEDKIPID